MYIAVDMLVLSVTVVLGCGCIIALMVGVSHLVTTYIYCRQTFTGDRISVFRYLFVTSHCKLLL